MKLCQITYLYISASMYLSIQRMQTITIVWHDEFVYLTRTQTHKYMCIYRYVCINIYLRWKSTIQGCACMRNNRRWNPRTMTTRRLREPQRRHPTSPSPRYTYNDIYVHIYTCTHVCISDKFCLRDFLWRHYCRYIGLFVEMSASHDSFIRVDWCSRDTIADI